MPVEDVVLLEACVEDIELVVELLVPGVVDAGVEVALLLLLLHVELLELDVVIPLMEVEDVWEVGVLLKLVLRDVADDDAFDDELFVFVVLANVELVFVVDDAGVEDGEVVGCATTAATTGAFGEVEMLEEVEEADDCFGTVDVLVAEFAAW